MVRTHPMSRASGATALVCLIALVVLAVWVRPGPRPGLAESDALDERPKNLIVMIGDGMGYNHVAVASGYQFGRIGAARYEGFPVTVAMSTYPEGGSYRPEAVRAGGDLAAAGATDSAAAATALSTGHKTSVGAIGIDPRGRRLTHLLETADRRGRSTGVVTTVPWAHATPAGFVAHAASRDDTEGIATEMIRESPVDVIMGAGDPCFDDNGQPNACTGSTTYVGGDAVWADLTDADSALGSDADGDGVADRWSLVRTRRGFQSLASGQTPGRVLGIASAAYTLGERRDCLAWSQDVSATAGCLDEPYATGQPASVPTLEEMTRAALNVLDDDPDGLALMVEGGAIDTASHDNSLGRLIEELVEFNRAVEAVISWIDSHGGWEETLLVITADHECGQLTGPGSDPFPGSPVARGAGKMPAAWFTSTGHSNSLVPLFARGRAATSIMDIARQSDPTRGRYVDNASLGALLNRLMG